MKRFLHLFLAMTMILTCFVFPIGTSAATPQKATQSDGTVVDGVTIAYGTPAVDGDIDAAWADVPGYKTAVNYFKDGKSTATSEWKFMWDEDRLYALCVVTDSDLITTVPTYPNANVNDCAMWILCFGDFAAETYNQFDGDAVVLYNNYEGATADADKDKMFGVALMDKYDGDSTTLKGYIPLKDNALTDNFARAQKKTSTGYVVEFSCDPVAIDPDFELKAGATGGIDATYRDSDTATKNRIGIWTLNSSGNTGNDFMNGHGRLVPFTLEAAPVVEGPTEGDNADTGDVRLVAASVVLIATAGLVLAKKR